MTRIHVKLQRPASPRPDGAARRARRLRSGMAAAAAASIAIASTSVVAQEKPDQGFAGLPAKP